MGAYEGWEAGPLDAITDVPGIRVGHWTDRRKGTGCTVILAPATNVAAVDARGGAPGTRETDVLAPGNVVQRCHAVVFCGGSAFGLAAADGVMRYLAEQGIGFETRTAEGARSRAARCSTTSASEGRPGSAGGRRGAYRAAKRARGGQVETGTAGAGTGATAAKLRGIEHATKTGSGTASVVGPRGLVAGALAVANPVGIVVDPDTGETLAGVREAPGAFQPLTEAFPMREAEAAERADVEPGQNTVLVCVATNAQLSHGQAQRLAYQAHDGLARCIVPAHTFGDGDIAFALSIGDIELRPEDSLTLGWMVARAVERAIVRAARDATGLGGVPSGSEWIAGGG
ncbi:MAG: P1 family peptidase [Dehalococcoidia bacterium]|nr:P1 family peptidase [Dehalococcoidia bacterium]